MKYAFYDNGKFIAEYELYDEQDAKERALELACIMSTPHKSPSITYKEVKDE